MIAVKATDWGLRHLFLADEGEAEAFLDAVCICGPPLAVLQDLIPPNAGSLTRSEQTGNQLRLLDSAYHCKLLFRLVELLIPSDAGNVSCGFIPDF